MNTQNRNLFVTFCFIVSIAGCSNGPSIQSVTDDKVVISAQPEAFVQAFELARKECQKSDKFAQYISDETTSLKEVAFNCVAPETEA